MLNVFPEYGFSYSSKRLPFKTYASMSFRVIFPFKYFSIISPAILPAQREPQYPFSTITAIAIFGLSLGANAIKIE